MASSLVFGIIMLVVGLFIFSLASYFYIGSGFGAGPRDSLMVVLTRKTGLAIRICRGTIEILAVLIGWILEVMIGIGTNISAFVMGLFVQTTFKVLKFDAKEVKHETLDVTFKMLFNNKKDQLDEKEVTL